MRPVFIIILFVGACSGNKQMNKNLWSPEEIQTTQVMRTAEFDQLVGRGVIGFKWTDKNGTHKEQGDLDFWKQGTSVSFRVSKLGELIAWFGGEGKDFWFFDMMGDEPTLTLGGEHGLFNDVEVALILLGLSPLPKADQDGTMTIVDGVITVVDIEQRTWMATFDAAGARPLSIELNDGSHKAKATHKKGIRVEINHLHELHWPETGGHIMLTDNQGDTEIKIIFSDLSTIVEDEPFDRVMNLGYLRGALKPTIIVEGNEE